MSTSVIVAGARTPMGRLLGSLKGFSGAQLGGVAIKAALERAGVAPEQVEYVIMGQVLTAGAGQIPARQAAVKAGIPMSVPALTVNKVCLSGLDAIALADQLIRAGEFDIVVAGGQESMTNAPHLLPGSRDGHKYGAIQMLDAMAHDGLTDAFENVAMGESTEAHNTRLGIGRPEQDEIAARSHQRAAAAQAAGRFADELVPVTVPGKRGKPDTVVDRDEHPRADITVEKLGALRPIRSSVDEHSTVTAGNASGQNDGAALCVVTTRDEAEARGLTPMLALRSWAVTGCAPEVMGIGPVSATAAALERAGLTLDDVDVIELNEAFAAQALAVLTEWKLDPLDDRINPNGSGISLGHPIGATGARILATAAYEARRRQSRFVLETMCIGGGQGLAAVFEAIR